MDWVPALRESGLTAKLEAAFEDHVTQFLSDACVTGLVHLWTRSGLTASAKALADSNSAKSVGNVFGRIIVVSYVPSSKRVLQPSFAGGDTKGLVSLVQSSIGWSWTSKW